jgi:hypothetical protein
MYGAVGDLTLGELEDRGEVFGGEEVHFTHPSHRSSFAWTRYWQA